MIVFLYGPDDYRRAQKKREIIAEFEKKHSGLGVGAFDLQDAAAAEGLREFARSQSIFESAKLAIVENAFEMEAKKLAALLAPLAAQKGTTLLLSEREKPVKALAFLLEKPALAQKFDALQGAEFAAFIAHEAGKAGIALAPAAVQFLATVYEGNSWALVTELGKLASFRSVAGRGSTRPIDRRDLDAFDLEAAPNYWALLNGMKSADGRMRLRAFEMLLAQGDPAPKLFNILAAQAGGNAPRMAAYDIAIKSGKLEYEEALLDLVLDPTSKVSTAAI